MTGKEERYYKAGIEQGEMKERQRNMGIAHTIAAEWKRRAKDREPSVRDVLEGCAEKLIRVLG